MRLRELRKHKKMSMKELGAIFGLAESTISLYETGGRRIDTDLLQRFADYFNVSTDYLLGRTDDPAFTIPEYQYFSEHELTEEEKKKVDEYVELLIKARK